MARNALPMIINYFQINSFASVSECSRVENRDIGRKATTVGQIARRCRYTTNKKGSCLGFKRGDKDLL